MNSKGIPKQAPSAKGCLWHWGNNVTMPQLKLDGIPQGKRHPLTQKAVE